MANSKNLRPSVFNRFRKKGLKAYQRYLVDQLKAVGGKAHKVAYRRYLEEQLLSTAEKLGRLNQNT